MFCPRCGSPNTDTTKYCRQCGLPMIEVTGYVVSGGTNKLAPMAPPPSNPIAKVTHNLTPKQKMALSIILVVMSPAILGILGTGELAGIAAIMIPILIPFIFFYFRNQARELEAAQRMQLPYPPPQAVPPPPPQAYISPIAPPPAALPQSVYQPEPYRPPTPTNPLKEQRGSVTEDETRKL